MTRGGARIRSGPPADPNALRRERDKAEWIHLPGSAEAEAPAWPLIRATKRERVLWDREWRRPQALMWRRFDQVTEVAIYVRTLREAERPGAAVSLRTLLRQQMDALGLTGPGLRSLRWIIDMEEPSPDVQRPARTATASAKERFQLIEGGPAAS